jgi:hypothetical protein
MTSGFLQFESIIHIVVFNDIRAVSVIFNMLVQTVHTNSLFRV